MNFSQLTILCFGIVVGCCIGTSTANCKCDEGCWPVLKLSKCYQCDCSPPPTSTCENVRCAAGTACAMVEVTCITTPCYPVPQCLPANPVTGIAACENQPTFECIIGLQQWVTDVCGCYRCASSKSTGTCESIKCRKPFTCVLVPDNSCDCGLPCPSSPQCVRVHGIDGRRRIKKPSKRSVSEP